MNTVLFPGLLIVLVLLLLAALGSLTLKRGGFPATNFLTLKNLRWVFAVYTIVLLLSMAVLYNLPQVGFSGSTRFPVASVDLFGAARTGKLEQTPGVFAKGKWSFDYGAGQLEIAREPEIMIWAQRKDTEDGKLEVGFYLAKTSLEGVDYTDKIESPSVELSGSRLTVKNASHYQIKLAKFTPDFTVSQFSGGASEQIVGSSSLPGVLFLRFPKNVNIDNRQSGILFVSQ